MRLHFVLATLCLILVTTSSAVAKDCPASSPDCMQLLQRWDITGFYYVTGQTLTTKSGNIAKSLLKDNTVVVNADPNDFPANAKLLEAYVYWSGAREVPDTQILFKAPGMPLAVPISAQKCYVDSDNRTGSISRNFYNCRASILANLNVPSVNHFGTYRVGGVDSVIIPGGNSCTTTKECYQEAAKVSGNPYSSCKDDKGSEICKCEGISGSQKCSYGQSTIGHASFALVFIYDDGGDQTRSIFLYDGMEAIIAQTVEIELDNLQTPNAAGNKGQLSYYIVEGDDDDVTPTPFPVAQCQYGSGCSSDADCKADCPYPGKKSACVCGCPKDNNGVCNDQVTSFECVGVVDNPGENVTWSWGADDQFSEKVPLENDENLVCDDPFNSTTGAGVDIESFNLDVPAKQTQAKLTVESPNLSSVNLYQDEICTDPNTNNKCGDYHKCDCKVLKKGTNNCQQYACFDTWANDGIGVNFVVVGFDAFAPAFVNVTKAVATESNAGQVSFKGDLDGDKEVAPGEQVQFSCTAANVGTAVATNLKLVDPLAKQLEFAGFSNVPDGVYVSYSGHSSSPGKSGIKAGIATVDENNVLTVELDNLQINETVVVYFNVTLSKNYDWPDNGETVSNQAEFHADDIEPVVTDGDPSTLGAEGTDQFVKNGDNDDIGGPDGIFDDDDNCPDIYNPDQLDTDDDGLGDACDDDDDNDGTPDADDGCPLDKNFFKPEDKDKCLDSDNDGIFDGDDNCPNQENPLQEDYDKDNIGDVCDDDIDGDGLTNSEEENNYKTNQKDADTDDDGLLDGEEINGLIVKDDNGEHKYVSNPNLCDTDKDGLPDGLEAGVKQGDKHPDTLGKKSTGQCFIADANPRQTTDPSNPDTDGGGVTDGEEERCALFGKSGGLDACNGKIDGDEIDPNDPRDDFVISGGSRLITCASGTGAPINGGAVALLLMLSVFALSFRHWRRLLWLGLFLVVLVPAENSYAQTVETSSEVAVDYRPFRFAGNSKGLIYTEAGELEAPMDFSLGIGLSYSYKPVVLRKGTPDQKNVIISERTPVERRAITDIQFALGLSSFFEIGLYVPMVAYQTGTSLPGEPLGDTKSFALGDVTLTPKLKIAGSRRGGGFLTLVLPVTFPSGQATPGTYAHEPNFSFRPRLAMSAGRRVVWAMNLGAIIREKVDDKAFQQEHDFTVSTGFEFGLVPDTSFLTFDVYGSTPFTDFFTSLESTPLEALVAFKQRFRKVYATFGGGMGITQGRGVPEWRVLFNLHYASELLDRDGDGIGDDDDQCPDDPEDFDKWQDVDGCPDPDNDNDGILDTSDDCPNEPEDVDGFEDGDGCPELDNDKDGVVDADDRCPLQPEDKDNFQDEDGCPEADNDKDGILDAKDKCPNEPEDKDGWNDQDGCPDPDNDGDKILDKADKCPNEPEKYNGYRDEDGCPDIVFTCKEFIIPEKIFFKTGSARIMKKSHQLLNVVAETIIAHPEAALTEIQGHTDKRGGRRYNLKLSGKRAKSVVKYLLKKGVPADRLVSKGYGFDKPFEPGKDGKEFYAKNRRVQFIVLKIDPTKSKKCQK